MRALPLLAIAVGLAAIPIVAAADPQLPPPQPPQPAPAPPTHRKKAVAEEAPVAPSPTGEVLVAAGASAGLDRTLGALPAARLSFYFPSGLTISATGAAKQLGDVRESATALLLGYRLAVIRGRASAWAGLEAGGGVAMEGSITGAMTDAPLAVVTPHVGASVRASATIAVGVEVSLTEAFAVRDGAFTALALPAAWVGALFDL